MSVSRSSSSNAISYAYDLRGWLTNISTSTFTEELFYADSPGTALYNGNISSIRWKDNTQSSKRGYKFSYDSANRLTSGAYGEGDALSSNTNRYSESMSYDANGNITGLTRYGNSTLMDNLTISYAGNQPTSVSESASDNNVSGAMEYKKSNGSGYKFNANGSLVADKSRGIAYITYDYNNNPKQIYFTNGSVTKYVYSASGQKLRTVHYTAKPNITRNWGVKPAELTSSQILQADSIDYLLGGSLTMKNGRIDKYIFDGGYAQASVASSTSDNFTFYYYTPDHLGNIREVVNASGTVQQVTNYYPYGVPYAESTAADFQPYKYNGKELDKMHGLNTYDYGARQHDPILARWGRIDPLCEKYYSVSPYVYCGNSPVKLVDPDGKDVWLFATKLPGIHVPFATHTFLVVTGDNGEVLRYAAYGPQNGLPVGGDKLTECNYQQDIQVYTDYFKGENNENLKGDPQKVNVPKGMKSEQFDKKVIETINSFGNKDGISYILFGGGSDKTSGNCNSSSSTILIKSGVGEEEMKSLESNIEGINTGFQTITPKPWTKDEQEKALEEKGKMNRFKAL